MARAEKPPRAPRIKTFGQGVVWRYSDSGAPPWKAIAVVNVFGFRKKPTVGDKVTLVPIDVELAPFELTVFKARKRSDCGKAWWDLELEVIAAEKKEIADLPAPTGRSAGYAFDVAVIYPAVGSARPVKRERLAAERLPEGVVPEVVKMAVDLDGDDKPEYLVIEHCCDDPKKPALECDTSCGKTFRKTGGSWKVIDSSKPC
jgi:hypothetical protein